MIEYQEESRVRKEKNGKGGKNRKDGKSVVKEVGDLTAEDVVSLLSKLEILSLSKTNIKANGFYDIRN